MIALSVCGCQTEVPNAEYYQATHQKVMASASHWQLLASQTALELRQILPSNAVNVYLVRDTSSPFSQTFGDLLTTALVQQHIFVSTNPSEQYFARVDVEVVRHNHDRVPGPIDATLLGTVAGAAVWAADRSPSIPLGPAIPAIGAGIGALADLKRAYYPSSTNTEVIVSTAISSGSTTVAAKSDVFYVENSDACEYDDDLDQCECNRGAPRHPLRVVGG